MENLNYDRLYIFNASDVTIKDSNFENGDGLKIFHSEDILVENVTFQNNSGDIRIRHSKVTIESCRFNETSKSIHIYNFYFDTSLWINNSTFENIQTAIDTNQVVFSIKNTHIFNTYAGIMNFDEGILENVTFENCTRALHKGNPDYGYIYNSTFINCSTEIDYDSNMPSIYHHLFLINCTFNESRFDIDNNVNITVGWFVDVYVQNQSGKPVRGFFLNITDVNNITQTLIHTDESYLKSIIVAEKRFNPHTTYYFNPYNISVSNGFSKSYVEPEPDVFSNRVFIITLYDNGPPITSHNYDGDWHNSSISVHLTAIDDITSVKETLYKINDGDTRDVLIHGMPEFTQEGINKLEYWSLDLADNEESHHFLYIKLDFTPPETSGNISMDWYNEDINVNLLAHDNLSGVSETFYRINSGPQQSLKLSGQPIITTEGDDNTLEYWSVDKCGNEENHTFVTNIKLDKTSPVASFTANRTVVVINGSVHFDASASMDPPPGEIITYSWDFNGDGIYDTSSEITQYNFTAVGRFKVTLKVTDIDGNWNTKYLYIDVEPDSDNDGIPDSEDTIPDDEDPIPDDEDTIPDDEDGILDDEDEFPLDSTKGTDITFYLLIIVLIVIISLILTLLFLRQKREPPENEMDNKEPETPSQDEEKLPPPQALKPPPPPPLDVKKLPPPPPP